ncbi:MAG: FHA domain-containing protein [Nostocaceae cyanobacterium]|nr:FHA domain-containing protein [Nostocaceae cyanobacterium]
MNALTLQWYDLGEEKTQQIYEQQPSKHPGTVRIGRDPLRCDIVLSNEYHPTVSRLHVEIFFYPQQQRFLIKNLQAKNPPLVDGQILVQGEVPLGEGSIIVLGQTELKVLKISVSKTSSMPVTVLTPPKPQRPTATQPVKSIGNSHHYYHHQLPKGVYGLQCSNCQKISSTEYLQVGCPWCGTSLAAAVSVLVEPTN